MNGPAHEILILITQVQKPPLNANTDVSSGVRYLTFCLSLLIQPYFANIINKGSCESAHLRRLARAFVVRRCYKYPYLKYRLKLSLTPSSRPMSISILSNLFVSLHMFCFVLPCVFYDMIYVAT